MLFSREATPIYIPTTVHKGPLPSTSLLTRPSFHFDDGHSDRWGDSSLRFWFAMSLMMNEVEHLFIDLLVNCVPSFGKCLFRYFAHFNLFLAIELYVVHCSVALVSDSLWDCSTPGFPVHHQLLELAQTHVHWVSDATQPSHPLSSPSPPAFNLSQHQSLL